MSNKPKKSPFIVIARDLITSKAWLSLGGTPQSLYLLFLTKRVFGRAGRSKEYVCTNAKELTFYYREAEKYYGITQTRFTRGIDQLVDRGFIDIVEPGIGTARMPTKYGLSDRWRKYGTPEFESKKREPVKRGYCKTDMQKEHTNSHVE